MKDSAVLRGVSLRIDPHPDAAAMKSLMSAAWGKDDNSDWVAVLACSLMHIGAYDGDRLVGFVNVAWDGGTHATIFDTAVHPHYGRRGIGTALVREAARLAAERGAGWLHVDYEPHLASFYANCGFVPTTAGLIKLR